MSARIDYRAAAPDGLAALMQLENYVRRSGLEPALLHLIKTRASQINGCAYCIDMHTKDARAGGETEQRLYALSAWREAPFYTERERAALAWTEAVTRISDGAIPDALYERTPAVQREGTGGPDPGGDRDRRLEPACDPLPNGGGVLQTAGDVRTAEEKR